MMHSRTDTKNEKSHQLNGTNNQNLLLTDARELRQQVLDVVAQTPVTDMHTHLYAPQFSELNLWGIDALLTYHYLIAELFRSAPLKPAEFFALDRAAQADLIWEHLFVRNTPLSEATRGVVAVLTTLGLDPRAHDLREARAYFATQQLDTYLTHVLDRAGVSDIVMTNDPLDETEVAVWESGVALDSRFHAALRIDPILNDWARTVPKLQARGYDVTADLGGASLSEVRRFLAKWIKRMQPLYLAVSLPDDFAFPDETVRTRLLRDAVLPTCREFELSFSPMIGVRRSVNPELRLAGDGLGQADVAAVERLCVEYPENRFLVTMLSRENQHALCVAARKFSNLMPFGCWWFLNNPSIVTEITYERIELLGATFVAQHSDARILDQLLYKWPHSRRVIAEVLYDSYHQLLLDGRAVTRQELERDVARLFAANFRDWVGLPTTTTNRKMAQQPA